MNSDILLNEASHIDETSWEALIGGLGMDNNCNEFTCNNGFTCDVFNTCKLNEILKPGCIVYKETAKLTDNKSLPISIASLSF